MNNMEKTDISIDRNGYPVCNGVTCPHCDSRLQECREVAYPNGEVYIEFDCTKCDFTGRLRKGNLYDGSIYDYLTKELEE